MTELQIRIPQNEPALETAIQQFFKDEFQQESSFSNELANEQQHKNGDAIGLLWQVLTVLATIEGSLQFSERVGRLERVKKLVEAIKHASKPVYLKLKGKTVNLNQKSPDEIMDLLAENDKENN